MPTPIAIAVVEHDGCFLIGQRPPGVPLAGLWEFPGGKIQPGELPEAAAVRECAEETGLAVQPLFRYAEHVEAYEHGHVRLVFVACRPRDPSAAPSGGFCWAPADELSRLKFPAGNDELLALLAARSRPVSEGQL
jgi:8-oxo-dGTP diphosphatase